MKIVGSSLVSSLARAFSVTGPTGATGITGSKGLTGYGLTGISGSDVIGISLNNRYILTTFSDGTTYQSSKQIYGTTGPTDYVLDIKNLGTGFSLATQINKKLSPAINFGITPYQEIVLRGITFTNNTDSLFSARRRTVGSNIYYEINLQQQQGLTVASSSSSTVNLLQFDNNKAIQRINLAYGVTLDNGTPTNLMGINFIGANIFEKTRGIGWTGSTGAVNCVFTLDGITCTLDPFKTELDSLMFGSSSKVFIGDFKDNKTTIELVPPPIDGNAYSFDLFLSGALNPTNINNRFRGPIYWPKGNPPCFSVDGITCGIKMTFFGINGTWYSTAVSTSTNCSDNLFKTNCTNIEIPSLPENIIFSVDAIGACCTSDGNCSETSYYNCSGYFHGIGTTCGTTLDSICSKPGVCCRKTIINGIENIDAFSDQLTCYECLGFTDQTVKFAGNYTTKETTNCNNVFNRIGACCNGRGGCSQLTREECDQANGFYQGDDIDCVDYYGNSICGSGTGPCCINGSCTEQSYLNCFASNGLYGGNDKSCSNFICPTKNSCLGFINGIPVYEGSQYAGGIVVGTFNPGISEILGAKELFDFAGFTLTDNDTLCKLYKNASDYYAYGTTGSCSSENNSYVIIIYPYDIAIDGFNNIKNPETELFIQNKFVWGGTGSSWGPLNNINNSYNDVTFVDYDYRNTHLKFTEGYWSLGFTGATQANNQLLLNNTFATCNYTEIFGNDAEAKQFAKSPYNAHGLWYRSWGLMNTIRAISAYNFYTLNKNEETLGIYNSSEFVGITKTNAFLATRLISDGLTAEVQGITANPSYVSSWFLPSHDEFGFIASKTINNFGFNINQSLANYGQPLNGTYWTSTGTFLYSNNEGIYDGINKPSPGSVAIAINIDVNGDLTQYNVLKLPRKTTSCKVRPIRIIRCNQDVPNLKLWSIPKIINSNIN